MSDNLCMMLGPCNLDGSFGEPFWVKDSKLGSCGNPFSDAPASLLETPDVQMDLFGCGVVSGKATARFGGFADDPVETFNRFCGVDDIAHSWRGNPS